MQLPTTEQRLAIAQFRPFRHKRVTGSVRVVDARLGDLSNRVQILKSELTRRALEKPIPTPRRWWAIDRDEQFRNEPVLRFRAYAHDRFTLTAYMKPPMGLIVSGKKRRKERTSRRSVNLVKRHELRRSLKIAGRIRFRPVPKKFTVHGRNWLRDAAHIIEISSKGLCLFTTFTVAGDGDEIFETLGIASSYIVDRMNRWLRYKVVDGLYCYCWELQQRGAPHMHYLFRVANSTDLVAFKRAIHAEWRKILLDVAHETGVDVFRRADGSTWIDDPNKPRVNFIHVTHRYANYISKYCSKERTKTGVHSAFRPSTWWGISDEAREKIRAERIDAVIRLPNLRAAYAVQELIATIGGAVCSMFKWCSPIEKSDVQQLSFYSLSTARRAIRSALAAFAGHKSLQLLTSDFQDINRAFNTS